MAPAPFSVPPTGPMALGHVKMFEGASRWAPKQTIQSINYKSIWDIRDDMAALMSTFARRQNTTDRSTDTFATAPAVPVLPPEAIPKVELLKELLQHGRALTPDRFLSMAFEIFPDPSELLMALRTLREAPDVNEADRERIDRASDALVASEGLQKIQAGINAHATAAAFGGKLDMSTTALRQIYRLFVLTQLREHAIYRYIMDTFTFGRRWEVVTYLQAALAADVRSALPSSSPVEFAHLGHLLYQLRLLRAADVVFIAETHNGPRVRREASKRRVQDRSREERDDVDDGQAPEASVHADAEQRAADDIEEQLIRLMLKGVENADGISEQVVTVFQRLYAQPTANALASFVQRLVNGFASVPIELFQTLNDRNAVVAALASPLKEMHFPAGFIGAKDWQHA